ncbi:MAG: hypothetical protein NUV67_03800 [archaeon]|nr:hypothetical protein [archaeon]
MPPGIRREPRVRGLKLLGLDLAHLFGFHPDSTKNRHPIKREEQ